MTLISSGTATSGTLSRKNEIAEAKGLLEGVVNEVNQAEEEIARLQSLVDEDAQMLSSIDDEIREKQDMKRGAGAGISIQNNIVAGCDRRLSQLQGEVQNAENKIRLAQESKNSDQELNEALATLERTEDEYARVNDELSEQDTMFREKEEEVRELERSAQDKNAKLTQKQRYVMRFMITNEKNFESNDTVYGKLMPNVVYTFNYKKQNVFVAVDFGLRKWQIQDENGKPLIQFDLKDEGLLYLTHLVFPENEMINYYYDNKK